MAYFGFASPGSDNRMTIEWQMSTPYKWGLNGKSLVTGWMSKTAKGFTFGLIFGIFIPYDLHRH